MSNETNNHVSFYTEEEIKKIVRKLVDIFADEEDIPEDELACLITKYIIEYLDENYNREKNGMD